MSFRPISFVIPSFNSAETIGECLDSVLSCAIGGDEIIICDNSSSDSTIQVCEMRLKKCNIAYKIISNTSNIGPVRNWLLGISSSKNDWIKLLFSDDTLLDREFSYARLLAIPDFCDGIFSPALLKGSDFVRLAYGINQHVGVVSSNTFLKEMLHWRIPFSPTAMLFKRSYGIHVLQSQIIKSSEDVLGNGAGPDYALYLSAGLRGRLFYYDKAIACMRESKQSITCKLGSEVLRPQYTSTSVDYLTISSLYGEVRYLVFKESLRKYILRKRYDLLILNCLISPILSFKVLYNLFLIRPAFFIKNVDGPGKLQK